jgi:hypothetical protein
VSEPSAANVSLVEHFAALADPRVERTKLHPLGSILVIALCAVIGGAESWDDSARSGDPRSGRPGVAARRASLAGLTREW